MATQQSPQRQQGAALLLAMLVVTLVATLASAALWQQWRAAEVETAERQRLQAGWILTGALDWARLILREDARGNLSNGQADHLGEPWAMPLEEARLSSFLAADRQNNADEVFDAFLSGSVTDMQSRLNFMNLVKVTGSGTNAKVEVSEPDLQVFTRLYNQLNLPVSELRAAVDELRNTTERGNSDPMPSRTALKPRKFVHLGWLGLSPGSLHALEPYVTVLPERTPLNLNTASAIAIMASLPRLNTAQAHNLVTERERNPFKNLSDVSAFQSGLGGQLSEDLHSTRTRFFEVRGRLRLDDAVVEERSLVVRDGMEVRVLWRERIAAR
ncbi:MAG: hypothetical protein RLZZ352_1482 [Pseudomonadota bacterium]|jgi:general secretion pathway protein K